MTAGRTPITTNKAWNTPPSIIESVREVFGGKIALDPCSNHQSLVNAETEYVLPTHDGLNEHWDYPTIYVNPPYGTDVERGTRIAHWFAKMTQAASRGAEVISLVPVATNTRHWKEHIYPHAAAVCFLYATRLRFYINGEEDKKGAPMACAVIYYGSKIENFTRSFTKHGAVIPLKDIALPIGGAK